MGEREARGEGQGLYKSNWPNLNLNFIGFFAKKNYIT
jgi:hypothetical protein